MIKEAVILSEYKEEIKSEENKQKKRPFSASGKENVK